MIRVDGKRLPPVSPHVYLVLNKPRGVVSTMSDPQGRRTLGDLVADRPERLFHVGRLDTDTEGLHPAHQRRRLRATGRPPVVRAAQDLRRRGRRRRGEGDRAPAAATASTLEDGPVEVHAAAGCVLEHGGPLDRRAGASTRAATGSCAGCSTRSATRCAG